MHRYADAQAQHTLVYNHITQLRTLIELAHATVVLGIESNLGFEAQHTGHSLQRKGLKDCCPRYEGVDNTLGMLTTNKSKEVMCTALQELLSLNRLHVSNKFMSTTMSPKEMLNRIIDEMRAFMIYVDAPRSLFVQARRTYTGEKDGHQGDAIIALQMAVLAMHCVPRPDRYDRYQ